MELDIRQITEKLLADLDAEALVAKIRAEGVRLLYNKIADESKKLDERREENSQPVRESSGQE